MAELYPHFNERLRDSLVILLGEKLAKRVRISLAKDGSGVGGESLRVSSSSSLSLSYLSSLTPFFIISLPFLSRPRRPASEEGPRRPSSCRSTKVDSIQSSLWNSSPLFPFLSNYTWSPSLSLFYVLFLDLDYVFSLS